MGCAGVQRGVGLTEAQINELQEEESDAVPESLRRASQTVSWWQASILACLMSLLLQTPSLLAVNAHAYADTS